MTNVTIEALINSWRNEDAFIGEEESAFQNAFTHPAGSLNLRSLTQPESFEDCMTMAGTDDCNSTMVGPHGC